MTDLFKLILGILASRFKARATLEAENLVLRQQLNVLRRRTPKRPHLNNTDRCLFVWLYRWFPSVLEVVAIVRPETIIRWHRAGFRAYWRWRSRNRVGRLKVSAELRTLIGEMSRVNALWGAPRIHGELLKLGLEIAQSTVTLLGDYLDVRGEQAARTDIYASNRYDASQKLGEEVRTSGGAGVLYDSLRRRTGVNVVAHRPRNITDIVQTDHFEITVLATSRTIDVRKLSL